MPPAVDGAFARWLAERAGDRLVRLRDEMGFGDPDTLRRAGDKQSHDFIITELARCRPGDSVLSEEAERDDLGRLNAERVWIVDPLDGTREYAEDGRVDWAVHIGLWARDSTAPSRLAAAAVSLPAQQRVLATDFPPRPAPANGGPLRLVASRTRPPAMLESVAADLEAELVPMGSAGAKIAAVIAGDVDAYVHAGGQHEWDSAAPVGVALATGLHASRIDGSPLVYNQADPRLPDLVVCRKDLADPLLAAIARVA